MALKILQLKRQKEIYEAQRKELSELDGSFSLRSQELEKATEEAATQDDIDLVGEEISKFEAEQGEHEEKKKDLDKKISDIEQEMSDLADASPDEDGTPPAERNKNRVMEVRSLNFVPGVPALKTRANPFGMTPEVREQYLSRSEVKEFYENVVEIWKNGRAIDGTEIGIPEITISYIRDSVIDYSVLLKHIDLTRARGSAKIPLAGPIPEAIWTDCCATLNELDISFDIMYLDCWKVGGFIPVCNATLEDFGGVGGLPTLASEIEYNLLKAIGKALDRAILYGTGTKMPLGAISALAMASNPRDPSDKLWSGALNANIKSISGDGLELFKNIMIASAVAKRHGASGITWAMNENTWNTRIVPESLQVNSAGAMVAVSGRTFPVLGGTVEFLDEDIIKDGDIVGGYFGNYKLLERYGIQMARSEHYRFIQDLTFFKATARYDGSPITSFRDSFFAFNVNGGTPATSSTFPPDLANEPEEDLGA